MEFIFVSVGAMVGVTAMTFILNFLQKRLDNPSQVSLNSSHSINDTNIQT